MPTRKLVSFDRAMKKLLRSKANFDILDQQFTLIARGRIIELIPQRTVNEARGMLSGCKCADSSEYRDRNERNLK